MTSMDSERGTESPVQPGKPSERERFATLDTDAAQTPAIGADALEQHPRRLELREERLRVSKAEEPAGVVRVSKRITERLETVTVPVRQERLVIELMPGSGTARIGDTELREGETLEVVLLEERVTIGKEVAIAEDVVVRKEIVEHEEEFQETVRREELVIDQHGDLVVQPPDAATEPAP